jgi:hypothetical protein
MNIDIAIPEEISTNVYNRLHYTAKHRIHNQFYLAVKVACRNQHIDPITVYPVDIAFHFYQAGKQYDSMNLSAMAKIIEDGLRYAGVLHDDNQKHVREIRFRSYKVKDRTPYAVLTLTPAA